MAYLLAFNDKPLDLGDSSNPAVNYYNKCMAQLGDIRKGQNPNLSFPVNLEFTRQYYELGNPNDPEMPEVFCNNLQVPASVSVTVKVDDVLVSGKFTVYETMDINDKGKTIFTPRKLKLEHRWTFNDDSETNALLFFLLFASPYCEPLKDETGKLTLKYQNPNNNSSRYLIIRNMMQEEQVEIRKRKLRAEIQKLIWTDEGLESSKLLEIAQVYGISGADNSRNIESIRYALDNMIDKNNHTEMLKFMNQVNSEQDTTIKSFIAKGKDLNLVRLVETTTKKYWKLFEDEENPYTLLTCRKGANEDESLVKELLENYEKFKKVKLAVSKKQEEMDE